MFDHTCKKSACLRFIFALAMVSIWLLPPHSSVAQTRSGNYDLNPQLRPIVREQFNRAGLSIKWFASLPIASGQSLEKMFVHHGRLYALTNENMLYCMDAQRGVINWAVTLASPLPTCSEPFFYQDRVLFSLGKEVVQVRLTDGKIVQRLRLPFNISTAPARVEDRLFVGSDANFFYCIRLADGVTLWQSSCPAEPTGNVEISGQNVYFACKNGMLYVSRIEQRELVYSFQTFGRIPGFAIDRDQCFIASTDTTLYALEASTGNQLWNSYLAGGVLVEQPMLTQAVIYQAVEQTSLLAINRATGTLRFELNNGKNLLAESDDITYAMTLDNQLTVMDNRNGSSILSFLVQDFTISAVNTETADIFLAGPQGEILVLWPDHPITY